MRLVHFFVAGLIVLSISSALSQNKHQTADSSFFYDFGKIFYDGFLTNDQNWLTVMMADSIIVGETFSEGLYCSKEKILEFFANKKLPEIKKIKIRVCGDKEEKTIIYIYQKQILFTISVSMNEKIITRLGIAPNFKNKIKGS